MSTYEGWSNYPTWAVNLWLANDEGLYGMVSEYIEDEDPSVGELADYIEAMFEPEEYGLMPELPNGPASDILGWGLQIVDWREVAKSWLEA